MKHNAFIGSGSGKVGNLVAYVRGGVQLTRVYQPIVANPDTTRQQVSRAKLKLSSELGRGLAGILRVGFGEKSNSLVSPRNLFSAATIPVDKGVIVGTTPQTVAVQYEALQLSDGTQPGYLYGPGEADFTTPLQVSIPLDILYDDYNSNHTSDGEERSVALYVVAYNKSKGLSTYMSAIVYDKSTGKWNSAYAEGQNAVLTVPEAWQGDYVEVYMFSKLLPDALNGVPVATEPYRIPGPSTVTMYCGNGRIA